MKILDQNILDLPKNIEQLPKIALKCTQNKLLSLFCCNNRCAQTNPLLCQQFQCPCNIKHESCKKHHIKYLLKQIHSKIYFDMNQFKLQINSIFADIQNKISLLEEDIIKNIDQKFKFINLKQDQKVIYQIFRESNSKFNQIHQFNGLKLNNLIQNYYLQDKNQNNLQALSIFTQYIHKIKQYSQQNRKELQATNNNINNLIQNYIKNIKNQSQKQNKKQKIQKMLKIPSLNKNQQTDNQLFLYDISMLYE